MSLGNGPARAAVDDDADALGMAKDALSLAGATVVTATTATTATDALGALHGLRFDAALLATAVLALARRPEHSA
jgi:DNA-binding response OmpR family regulator